MRLQDTAANCGPASLSNALAALGIRRSQDECVVLCKTTGTDGTTARNLLAAIRAVGRSGIAIRERRGEIALLLLERALRDGRPVVMCVDEDSHWVAAVGLLGRRFLVADPADNELVLTYDAERLLDRWGGTTHYGVIV